MVPEIVDPLNYSKSKFFPINPFYLKTFFYVCKLSSLCPGPGLGPVWSKNYLKTQNKLKSLKVAQVKDEMDDDKDDGCDGVCDDAW